jgi:peptidyl-tRNA hydrolase, PTH2 family
MYALIREDLGMTPGKIASQAGHAFVGAAVNSDSDILSEYHKEMPNSPGTKVCLKVPNLPQLYRVENLCKEAGIPTFVVVDSGCANFFNGKPIVTALGIGPVTKQQLQGITNEYKLL